MPMMMLALARITTAEVAQLTRNWLWVRVAVYSETGIAHFRANRWFLDKMKATTESAVKNCP